MNLWGAIFMALSWATILFLVIYSFGKIFSEKPEDNNGGQ
jgi:hypothetical protein